MAPDQIAGRLELLVDFANTYDVDGTESLGTPGDLRDWLVEHGLLAGGTAPDHGDLELAHAVRSGFREAMAAHHEAAAGDSARLTEAAARLPLVVSFDRAVPRLVATGTPVEQALGGLLVAAQDAAAAGVWSRLKLCAAATCRYAFYDESKNHSRTWCSMQVCGNRQKTRTYRRRQAVG